MSAIDTLFKNLRAEGRKAFMPFITAGDPDLAFTADVLRTLAEAGSHMCELGIPYSDPIADGPVIQSSYTRALDQKIKVADIMAMLGGVTPSITAPVVTMVSYAIVYRHGLERYVEEARAAGVAGAIVPDLPVEESAALAEICAKNDFSLIQLVAPTTSRERQKLIAERSTGFIYYVSVAGTTGARTELPPEIVENVAWLKEQTETPICIGFGISRPEHVKMLTPVADGVIVGSAIVRQVAQCSELSREEVLVNISAYAKELIAALDG